jgi:phosphate transport system substrate-binding protein
MKMSGKLLILGLALLVASAPCLAAKGDVKIAGSTTLLPLSQLWAEDFMMKNPSTSVSVTGGGSGVGISSLLNGTCNIANASRAAKEKEISTARERNAKLVATKCAKDGIALIVHSGNNVKNLTMDQLKAIYAGKVDTWNQVGGESKNAIVVVGRDSSSGTYGFFQEAVLGGGAYRKDMLSMATNAAVAQAVAGSRDAIGYVGMAYAWEYAKKGNVKVLSISRKKGEAGMTPTDETVKSGEYPLFRYLYMYTLGNPKGAAGEFVKYCLSPEGQAQVDKAGYLPLK